MKARDLMDIVEQEDIHEDDEDYGRLAEMVDRMDVDHVLALLAHICEDNAKEAEEEGKALLADTWRHDSKIIEEVSKKVG